MHRIILVTSLPTSLAGNRLALALGTSVLAALALPARSAMHGGAFSVMTAAGVAVSLRMSSQRHLLRDAGVEMSPLLASDIKEILDPLLLKGALLALQTRLLCHSRLGGALVGHSSIIDRLPASSDFIDDPTAAANLAARPRAINIRSEAVSGVIFTLRGLHPTLGGDDSNALFQDLLAGLL